jgi:hypothetical protein
MEEFFLLALSFPFSCYCAAGATSFFLSFTARPCFYKCFSRASCYCWPLVKSIMSSVTYFFLVVCDRIWWTWRVQKKKKTKATKKKKWIEEEEEEEKEIWSGTDGMYDATRYIKKKKTTKKQLNVFFTCIKSATNKHFLRVWC